ncbi:MAG: hypothetical protein E7256_10835 [Lachnospiraceae bacterium]|nr:hypothetical protein [Lachnospiraceae bacterium]
MRSVDMNIFQDESAVGHAYVGKNKKTSNNISQNASMMNTNEELNQGKEAAVASQMGNRKNYIKMPEKWQFTSQESSEEENDAVDMEKRYEEEVAESKKPQEKVPEKEEKAEYTERNSGLKTAQKIKNNSAESCKSAKVAELADDIIFTPEAEREFYAGCSKSFKSKRDGIVELRNPLGSGVNILVQDALLVNLCPNNIHVYVYSNAEVTCKMKESKSVANGTAGSDESANGQIFYGNEICIVGGTLVGEFMLPPFFNLPVSEDGNAILLPGTNRCYVFHSMEKEKDIMMNLNIRWVEEAATE